MANLTNSGKLITKIESIDSSISDINDKIGSIPAGTDIGQEISDIKDEIGTLPEGKSAAEAIADVDSKADGIASDLSDFETEVANTYATKDSVASAFLYKGSVATYADLPASGNKTGDVYNVEAADPTHDVKAGDNVAWNGSTWDVLSGIVDLSNYYTKSEVDAKIDAGGSAVEALANRVTTAEGKITTAEGKITTLEGKMTTAESDIDAVEGRLDTAESDIDAVEGRATALEGRMTTAESDIDAVEGRATSLEGRADALETAVEAIETSVPAEIFFKDVTLSGKVTNVSDANIKATSHISFVVKSGTLNGYYIEKEVAEGVLTITSSDSETATLEVMIINKKSA